MKKLLFSVLVLLSIHVIAQEKSTLYHPDANATNDIAMAVKQAKDQHKFVLIQAGGNWCKWCIEFARFAKADPQIDSVINSAFIWYHLNYSKENKNPEVFEKLGFPQRFGFPSFIILNENGERIHTQNSEYLEDGKNSYDKLKVQAFLEMWSPRALNPAMYGM
ncbi:MAG: thioredoxin family protein [Niastella sp.]|nr:thioredoxin family protein [Niastella sp.]